MGHENRRDRMFRDERGSVLIGGLILVLALTLIGVGLFEAAVIETGQVRFTEEDAKALYAAESGLNRAALDMSTNTSGTYWFCDLRGCPLLGVPGDATFQASDTPLALGYASTCFGKPAGTACDGSNNPTQPVYLVEAVRAIDPSTGTPYTDRFLLTSTACMPGPGANPCPAETRAMAQVKAMIKQGPPDATSTTTTTTTVTSTTTTRPGMPFAMFGGSQTCTASAPCLNIHPGNVDSYDSHKATCSSPTAGGICLQSTTNTGNNGSIASNGNITVQGAVHGNVIANTDVAGDPSDVGGSGHVYGYIKSGGQVVYTDPVDGGITQNQTTPQTPLPAEPNCGPPFTVLNTAPGGNVTLSGPGSYSYTQSTGQLSISSGKIVTLQPGTYCFGHVSVQNNGTQLAVSGPGVTAIFVDGVFEAKSGAQLNNSTQDPQSLQIISTYGNGIDASGNPTTSETGTGVLLDAGGTTMYMTVYAPTTKVLFQGGGNLYGAIVGKTVEYTGGSACPSMPCSTGVHFDEYLASGQANLIRGIPVPSTVTTTTTTTVTSTIYSYSYGSYSVVSWLQSNCRKTSSWLCS